MQIGTMPTEHGLAVQRVIEGGLLDAAYQPIIDLHERAIAGYETLARPRLGQDRPNTAELFDAAEQTGALWPLEGLARARSFAGASDWTPGRMLFVNCSPSVVRDERLIGSLLDAVASVPGLTPEQVVIEITERIDHNSDRVLTEHVAELCAHGFQVAIDDVGAGGSGLTRITRLRPAWIKIDRELIVNIDTDPDRQRLVEFLVDLAADTGASVIAEGIETPEELRTLAAIGVRYIQGYLLGRPAPQRCEIAPEAAALLAELKPIHHKKHQRTDPDRLPGRVACDRALLGAMQRTMSGYAVPHAAMIDLRGLDAWNLSRGFDAGDTAIATLGDLLRSETAPMPDAFLGHPGDDRFLLLMDAEPLGLLLEAVTSAYELAIGQHDAPGVRCIMLGEVAGELSSPADLYHLADALKPRADQRATGRSSILRVPFGSDGLGRAA